VGGDLEITALPFEFRLAIRSLTTPSAVGGHPSKEGNFVGGELKKSIFSLPISASDSLFDHPVRRWRTPLQGGEFGGR
jgi:hypothetical protein